MPHGAPDYWGYTPKEVTYALQDMAELAVRLGSIVNFDRRGEVVWFDDFREGASKILPVGSGAGNDVYPWAQYGLYSAMCLNLHTGNAVGDTSGFSKVLPYPVLGGVGLEVSFVPFPNLDRMVLRIGLFTGSYLNSFRAYYSHVSGNVYIIDNTGASILIGSPGIQRTGYSNYSTMKLVINALTNEYVRVIFNCHTYLAEGYSPYVTTDTTEKSMTIWAYAQTAASAAIDVRVGYVIVTQNEPL